MPKLNCKDPNEVKSRVIRLRVTEAEAQLFKVHAAVAGCKTISEYIRLRCIEESIDAVDTAKKYEIK